MFPTAMAAGCRLVCVRLGLRYPGPSFEDRACAEIVSSHTLPKAVRCFVASVWSINLEGRRLMQAGLPTHTVCGTHTADGDANGEREPHQTSTHLVEVPARR